MAFTRLTLNQATQLKTAIMASAATVPGELPNGTIQQFLLRLVFNDPILNPSPVAGQFSLLKDYYAAPDPGPFFVWRYNVPVEDIFDAINWQNLTPAVPSNVANQDTAALFRSNVCVSKQVNLQLMLQGRQTLDATRASTRAGLQDALTDVPSAVNGSARQAGWTNVQPLMARTASRIERFFAAAAGGANGDGSTAIAATRAVLDTLRDGEVPASDFVEMRLLP